MKSATRTTTIQVTLLKEDTPDLLRGRIRRADGAIVPFVGARDLVIQGRALLAESADPLDQHSTENEGD